MYVYFISYHFVNDLGGGVGRCEVALPNKINSIGEIEQIESALKEKNGLKELHITNFQFLREGLTLAESLFAIK